MGDFSRRQRFGGNEGFSHWGGLITGRLGAMALGAGGNCGGVCNRLKLPTGGQQRDAHRAGEHVQGRRKTEAETGGR